MSSVLDHFIIDPSIIVIIIIIKCEVEFEVQEN